MPHPREGWAGRSRPFASVKPVLLCALQKAASHPNTHIDRQRVSEETHPFTDIHRISLRSQDALFKKGTERTDSPFLDAINKEYFVVMLTGHKL